jgi:hypothetical protein
MVLVRGPQATVKKGRIGNGAAAAQQGRSGHSWLLFVLLCVAAGAVVGLFWTKARDGRERASPVANADARPAEPAPTSPKEPAAAPKQEPATARPTGLTPDDIAAVIARLDSGKPYERDEAERYLIWHGDKTSGRVRAALGGALSPQARASLRYVATAIEEEQGKERGAPFVTKGPPQRGLVLFCDSLEGRSEDIATMRRTAKATGIEATVVLTREPDAAAIVKSHAAELGDVTFYFDPDGSFAKKMRIERLPTLAGLRDSGRASFLLIGPVQRARLADQVAKLVK